MPDVKGYKLPNHDETYMYADAYARRFTPINAKEFEAHNDVMNIMTNGNLDSGNMWDSHIATEDASTLVNSPVTSGPFYATRKVTAIPSGDSYHITVTLHETYPVAGRIWTRMYDANLKNWTPSWQSSFDFAPSGYGLGTRVKINPDESLDDLYGNGFYWWETAKNTPFDWGYLIHLEGGEASTQIAWSITNDYMVTRKKTGWSTWGEWEWVNPPMVLGVEYRTTERCLGKAVYRQVVNFGALPNATSKAVAHGISGISLVTEAEILNMGGSSSLTDYVGISGVYGDGINVTIHTNLSSLSGVNVYVALKYIKN